MTNALTTSKPSASKRVIKAVSLFAFALLIAGGVAMPAHADWDDREGHEHEWHERGWERHAHDAWWWHRHHRPEAIEEHPVIVREAPEYRVYSPPVVYAPPPPQPTGLSLIIPLHFN